MVRRRGILGAAGLIVAGVAIIFLVTRSLREKDELVPMESRSSPPSNEVPDAREAAGDAEGASGDGTAVDGVGAPASSPGYDLRGRLVRYADPEAREPDVPAAGALVRLTVEGDPDPAFPAREVRSGPDGTFLIESVPAKAKYRLDVDAEGGALRAIGFELPEMDGDAPPPASREPLPARLEGAVPSAPPQDSNRAHLEGGASSPPASPALVLALPDIVLEEPERLVVHVKGPGEKPIEGAKVTARWLSGSETAREGSLEVWDDELEAREDGGGAYTFERLARGLHEVEAAATGFAGRSEPAKVPRADPLVLVLQAGQVISGTVRSTGGEPIRGAEVIEEESEKSAATDGAGRFELRDLTRWGPCSIRASAQGFCSVERHVQADEVDFFLPREAVLSGQVVESGTDRPLPGVDVFTGADSYVSTVTDATGSFELRALLPGSHEVRVTGSRYVPLEAGKIEVKEGQRVEGLVFTLEPGHAARGRVLSKDEGEPVPGAKVRAQESEATSDASGVFALAGLEGGECSVSVSAEGFLELTAVARLPPDSPEEWTFHLEKESVIFGRVLDPGGSAVAGATVAVGYRLNGPPPESFAGSWEKKTTTDSRGMYRFHRVPPFAGYCLLAEMEEHVAIAWMEDIAVLPGERKEMDIRLRGGAAIRGRVTDGAGSGVPGVSVNAFMENVPLPEEIYFPYRLYRTPDPSATTDASGEFEIPHLPAGSYEVRAAAERYMAQGTRTVELEESSVAMVDFVLQPGASVSGRVIDAAGRPLAGVDVSVSRFDSTSYGTTDAEGTFEVHGLPLGRGMMAALKPGYFGRDVPCPIPSGGNTVVLSRGAVIAGKIECPGEKKVPPCTVNVFRLKEGFRDDVCSEEVDATHRFAAAVLPGRFFIEAQADGFASRRREVEARPGERHEVVLELVRLGSIQVQLEVEGPEPGPRDFVWMTLESPAFAPHFQAHFFNDMSSEITFEGVPHGPASLTAILSNRGVGRLDDIAVTAGNETRATMVIRPVQGVFGTVTLRGEPAGEARVTARGLSGSRSARTSSSGIYELGGLSPGTYEITVDEGGSHAARQARRTAVVPEGGGVELEIEIAAAFVSGRVTEGGKPRAGMEVAATDLGGEYWSTTTGAEGAWSLQLPTPAQYRIEASEEEGALFITRELVLEEGQAEARVDIEIEEDR